MTAEESAGSPAPAGVDWRQPWLAAFAADGQSLLAAGSAWRECLNQKIELAGTRNHRGLPVQFIPQSSLPAGQAYETHISATGGVPTRDNLHDFFNALAWLRFPHLKVALNALQARELERAAPFPSHSRGKLRDGATIFDENAAFFVASHPEAAEALRAHCWGTLFLDERAAFGKEWEVQLFGHALMEKLQAPYKAITGHAWIVHAPLEYFGWTLDLKCRWLDATVSRAIEEGVVTSDFSPLPVLGVPGWSDGQDAGFYADAAVFRPPRKPGKRELPQ